MDGKKAKSLAEKLQDIPTSGGTYDLMSGKYNAPPGPGFLKRAYGKIKDLMAPEQQYEENVLQRMKVDWEKGRKAQSPGKGNWSSNYMDFPAFVKEKYATYAASSGGTVQDKDLRPNR